MRHQVVLRTCKQFATFQLRWKSTRSGLTSISCSWFLHHKLPYPEKKSCHVLDQCRRFSTTNYTRDKQDVLLPGNLIRSPIPDIEIPNVALHELLFKRFECFDQDAPAISEYLVDRSYTFGDIKRNATKVASALTRMGYTKGDTLLLFSTNNIDFTVLMLAASRIGVIISAANPGFTAYELTNQIKHCECNGLFIAPTLAETAKAALKDEDISLKGLFAFGEADGFLPFQTLLDDDGQAVPEVSIIPKEDLFILPYSSGTTGLPKGVMLTHNNVTSNVVQICNTLPIEVGENSLGLLPLFHIFGMVVIQFGSLYCGGHLHYLPQFEPQSFLGCLQDRKVGVAHLVPPLVLFLANYPLVSKYHLDNLRHVICGAAPLGDELTKALEGRFASHFRCTQGYGLTETCPVVTVDIGKNPGSIGHLACNSFAKIIDIDTEASLGPGQEGELCVKGPQVMKGYFKNQAATDDMITPEGWLHTGDIGYYHEDGLLFISGRLKELIKYKGSQVAPAELEGHLLTHEDVQDAAVVGIPDEVAGELPRAYVVKSADSYVKEEDLIKYIDEIVSDTKRLRGGVKFVDAIPRNPSGKILRRLLK